VVWGRVSRKGGAENHRMRDTDQVWVPLQIIKNETTYFAEEMEESQFSFLYACEL